MMRLISSKNKELEVLGDRCLSLGISSGDVVVDLYISYEKIYALLEMRSVEETQKCNGFGRHFIIGDPLKIDQSAHIGKSLPITWDLYELFPGWFNLQARHR
ncbi:hypothetical protein Tco_1278470 [Tanacetum coccineum]